MTYADLLAKYDAWKAKYPSTRLRQPSPEVFASAGFLVDDAAVREGIGRAMDEIIRLEELVVFQHVPYAEAETQVQREFTRTSA